MNAFALVCERGVGLQAAAALARDLPTVVWWRYCLSFDTRQKLTEEESPHRGGVIASRRELRSLLPSIRKNALTYLSPREQCAPDFHTPTGDRLYERFSEVGKVANVVKASSAALCGLLQLAPMQDIWFLFFIGWARSISWSCWRFF